MELVKLTNQDIEKCLLLATINERKSFYQKPCVSLLKKYKSLVCQIFTRGGKTFIGLNCIIEYQKSQSKRICIVVPSETIKNEWLKYLIEFNVNTVNIEIYIINSYTSKNNIIDKDYGLLIVDETHRCLSESVYFSQTIPSTKYDYLLCLSGSLDKEKLNKLKELNIKCNYQIPLEIGYKLQVIPEYITYNIPIQLTNEEKIEYVKLQTEYNKCIRIFESYSTLQTAYIISSCVKGNSIIRVLGQITTGNKLANEISIILNYSVGQIIGTAKKFNYIIFERSKLLYNAKNKLRYLYDNYKYLPLEQKLIFTYKTDYADLLSTKLNSSKSFHSKITKKNKQIVLDSFKNKEFLNLITCKSISEGFTTDCGLAIKLYFDSKQISAMQQMGRLLKLDEDNPDKVARMINIYTDDFIINGIEYKSQEKAWLKSSQYKMMFVEWIDNITEIQW